MNTIPLRAALLLALGAPLAAQAPDTAERVRASQFVVLAEVQSIQTIGETVDPEEEVIVKTYRATCRPLAVFKGRLHSPSIAVEYTRRIGVRTPHPELTIRKGIRYALFLGGTAEAGRFEVYSPYWGAARAFSDTEELLALAVRTGGGVPAGVEPAAAAAEPEPEPAPDPGPARPRDPTPEPPLVARAAPERAPAVDGFRAHLDGPELAFAAADEARLWFVVVNESAEPRSIYSGNLGPFLYVEVRPAGGGDPTVRVVDTERSGGPEGALTTVLGPGESFYFPVDLGQLFEIGAGTHQIRAILDLPASHALPAVGARPWQGRLLATGAEIRIGGPAAGGGDPVGDARFVRPGDCSEVHVAGFDLGDCQRCHRATSSSARAICQQCAHDLGVCGFCLKKRK